MSNYESRRQFLKKMAGIAAISAPVIIPSSAFGRSLTPPSERIALGHIGVGGRGSGVMRSFLQVDGQQSVAVCDPFQEKREQRAADIDTFYADKFSAANYKACAAYNDFRELLARDDIDAVVVATPDHWHVPIAIEAVKSGKDVYVEKPLGVSIHENQAIRHAVQKTGKIFQYGTQQRSAQQFRFAAELVRNGYIGNLQSMHAWCPDITSQEQVFQIPVVGSEQPIEIPPGFDYDLWLGPAPRTAYTADRCTSLGTYHHFDNSLGFIAGWGAHPLDIAQWGNNTDDTAPVYYEGKGELNKGFFETVRWWDFWCTYENGVKMRFSNQAIALDAISEYHPEPHDHGTTFFGDEGWVSVNRRAIFAENTSLLKLRLRPDDEHLLVSNNHYEHFIECVKTRLQSICPVNTAVQSDIISHLCDISIRVDRPIKWDPKNEKIIGDDDAARLTRRSLRSPWNI
jgi:hypothetical protein